MDKTSRLLPHAEIFPGGFMGYACIYLLLVLSLLIYLHERVYCRHVLRRNYIDVGISKKIFMVSAILSVLFGLWFACIVEIAYTAAHLFLDANRFGILLSFVSTIIYLLMDNELFPTVKSYENNDDANMTSSMARVYKLASILLLGAGTILQTVPSGWPK